MRKDLTLVSALLLFSILTSVAIAVAFTSTSDPTGTNAGQSSQLVNFSINNIGSVNITRLNITLPNGFTFTGSSGTTTSSPYTSSPSTPLWINTSSIGIVGNGATQYFWIYVNTPSSTGSYSFNVTTLDANAVFNSSNVTFSLFDILAPTYSSNTTSPSSNSTYSIGQSYWFNVTWTDGVAISKVLLEHNITGSSTPHNETMNNSSSVYYFNVTDLSAGIYVWRVYANDTNNTFNSTLQLPYIISRSSNELRVYLNGTLNGNITSLNNTAVNVTVNATCTQPGCNITVVRDGTTLVSGGTNPYSTNDIIGSIGLHNYTISVSSNRNYTSNSSTYYVATTPSYSISTSNIPLTFSNTTVGTINITFDTNPAFVDINIQGDWSGTTTNYTMSNTSLTNYYYNRTFPAGTSTWKIYGVYSNHSFNISSSSFKINQATPTLNLNITPQWILDSPVSTSVSCTVTVAGLTAKLYRNETAVSNPDAQTFSAGSIYLYACNNTADQNYTTNTEKNTLIIRTKPSTSLSFTQAPTRIEVVQNSTASSEIKVKNTGGVSQNITLEISGIDKTWYSITQPTTNLLSGLTATFVVTFNIGNVDVKDYSAKFDVTGPNATISQDFTLRALPSNETKLKINDTIDLYKLDVNKLQSKFDEVKSKINNTGTVEEKLTELKAALKQAEDYVNSNDYFQAQQTLGTVKTLISEVGTQLEVSAHANKVPIPSKVWLVIGAVIVVTIIGVMAYLFWPVKKGYKSETGEYVYGGGGEKKGGLFDAFKNLISKFKRKKKTETVLSES